MRRFVSLLSLLVVSWSHAAALGCDMGSMMMPKHHEMQMPADLAASDSMAEHPSAPRSHSQSGDAECLLMLVCGVTAEKASQFASNRRSPTISVEQAPLADAFLTGAMKGIDPPPPRHDV